MHGSSCVRTLCVLWTRRKGDGMTIDSSGSGAGNLVLLPGDWSPASRSGYVFTACSRGSPESCGFQTHPASQTKCFNRGEGGILSA